MNLPPVPGKGASMKPGMAARDKQLAPPAKKQQVHRPNKIDRPEVDYVNRAAEGFLQIYYECMDGPQRDANIAELYRDTSVLIWNGETVNGAQQVSKLEIISRLPFNPVHIDQGVLCEDASIKARDTELGLSSRSRYDDLGQPETAHLTPFYKGTNPTAILVTVSGIVLHGEMPSKMPQTKKHGVLHRIFSQSFVLTPEPKPMIQPGAEAGQEADRYFIRADTMRFVG
ncbi:SubName: Full=Uncharacterized protein {ECO:0000313/EMBL:CCA69585.1} [Serendipita indica DSM 11827]|nr:SubName: Full=Uncharacterized protein {ECO:0000313/EMBL:CCA69585.1} [Serendipita indica DSM 11827]